MKWETRVILIGFFVFVFFLSSLDLFNCRNSCEPYQGILWWTVPIISAACVIVLSEKGSLLRFSSGACFLMTFPLIWYIPQTIAMILAKSLNNLGVVESYFFDYGYWGMIGTVHPSLAGDVLIIFVKIVLSFLIGLVIWLMRKQYLANKKP